MLFMPGISMLQYGDGFGFAQRFLMILSRKRLIKNLINDAQKFIGLQIADNAVGIALLLIRADKKNRGRTDQLKLS